MTRSCDVLVCGAGIAGTAVAYHLAVRHGVRNVIVVDELAPLTLTSNKGTQGYRNWWPGPDATMLRMVSRSIDIMEEIARESFNAIRMSRRGYLFVTARDEQVDNLRSAALEVSGFGMGPLREHPGNTEYVPAPAEGFEGLPDGADLLLGDRARKAFPYLSQDVRAALHIRRAGWISSVALGDYSLTRALAAGATFIRDRVDAISTSGGKITGVKLAGHGNISAERVVLAAGPHLHEAGRMLGLEIPVFHELHAKVTFRDPARAVPRDAPFLIWTDGMQLRWSDAELALLAATEKGKRYTGDLPGGVHVRPVDGPHGDELYLIWTFDTEPCKPEWPPVFSEHYAEVLLRGLPAMVPAMARYAGYGASGFVDGGYYCKTRENRPLAGPLAVEGAYVCGALSGSGVMSAHGAADLVAAHISGAPLPEYAPEFLPSRYQNAEYVRKMERWDSLVGQL